MTNTTLTQLAEISKLPLADDQFIAACKLADDYKASGKSPLDVWTDLRTIADFIERIY